MRFRYKQANISLDHFVAVESDDGTEELMRIEFDNGQTLFMEKVQKHSYHQGYWRVHPGYFPSGMGPDVQQIRPFRCAVGEQMAFYAHADEGARHLLLSEGRVSAINPCDFRDGFHDNFTTVAA